MEKQKGKLIALISVHEENLCCVMLIDDHIGGEGVVACAIGRNITV